MGRVQVAADWLFQVNEDTLRQARNRKVGNAVTWRTPPNARFEAGRPFSIGFAISSDHPWQSGEWIGLYRKDEADADLESRRPERSFGVSERVRALGHVCFAAHRAPLEIGQIETL